MGNLFSKKTKVVPFEKEQNLHVNEIARVPSKRWYKKLLCCNINAVQIINIDANNDNKYINARECDGKSSSDSDLGNESNLELQGCEGNESISSAEAFDVCIPSKLKLPADRRPLPKIKEDDDCQLIQSGLTVIRNHNGKTRAVAFDVELMDDDDYIPNRPQSSLSMGYPASLPRRFRDRLPVLPPISKETIQRR